MSKTNTQRELIDYLWEWSETKGYWAKLLVEKLTLNQTPLLQFEQQEIFNYFLQEIGFKLNPSLPEVPIDKPSFSSSQNRVSLTKLSEIKGVNKLSENEILEFSSNITIIYGNNGVGKTGYSRILKSQGYSFDNKIDVLSNVHSDQVAQSARIDFESNGSVSSFNWNGERVKSELNAISVFNSDCVNISLSNTRELLVTPKGFYMFTLVRNELTELTKMLTERYTQYPINLPWKNQLHAGTLANAYIECLQYDSELNTLDGISLFTEDQKAELEVKENDLKELNKIFIESKVKSINLILTELETTILKVKDTQSKLSKIEWDKILKYNTELKKLKIKTEKGIAGLAETYSLEKFDSLEFITFLKSADSYIKLLANENYPANEKDTCVYCKQDLQNEQTRDLIDSYSKIINNNTEKDTSHFEKLKSDIIDSISIINEKIVFHQPTFGLNEDNSILQPQEVVNFNQQITVFKNHIVNDNVYENIVFDINYISVIQLLERKELEFLSNKKSLDKTLLNLSKIEKKLIKEIEELKDRELLSNNKQAIKEVISNLNSRKLLDDNKNKFNTTSLSSKTTLAREELVSQNFQNKFLNELTMFRKQHLGVNISFFSQQGSSKIRQNVAEFDINRVLSEGEQKTIALCEFLTELQLDTTVAPVIFDDPVNSLDHNIIQDVASRLVSLSKERQVVIFTHNVIFYNAFFELEKKNIHKANTSFKFYNVYKNQEKTGFLKEGKPINKVSTYTGKLNQIFSNPLGNKNENEVASEGYAYLRTGLELLVSNTIFQEIVGRYRNNIMMTKFPMIKGDMIEKHKAEIDEVFVRASGFIKAHSHPEEQNNLPTLHDLKIDYDKFKVIQKDFK